jgi:uncharacterized protein with HEPN domain
MSNHDDKVYLGHILESIDKVLQFTKDSSFESFESNVMMIDAVIRNFEIIGEASNNISNNFKESNPNIDFRSVISFRNRLAHGYDDINLETVWSTIKEDLPDLKDKIDTFL